MSAWCDTQKHKLRAGVSTSDDFTVDVGSPSKSSRRHRSSRNRTSADSDDMWNEIVHADEDERFDSVSRYMEAPARQSESQTERVSRSTQRSSSQQAPPQGRLGYQLSGNFLRSSLQSQGSSEGADPRRALVDRNSSQRNFYV